MQASFLRIETLTGQPIKMGNNELQVRSQVIQFRLPLAHGGLIWNRPVAVVVRSADGQERILPVSDPTRFVVLNLAGLCFASLAFLLLFRRK